MLDGDLRRAAVKCLRLYGVLGLSVVAADVETAEELARRGRRRLETYSVIHVCRARSLGAPYELLPTWAAPHYTLRIPGVEPGHLASLRARFDRIANPLVRGP